MQHAIDADEFMFLQKPQLRGFYVAEVFPWASQNSSLRLAELLILLGVKLKSRAAPAPAEWGLGIRS